MLSGAPGISGGAPSLTEIIRLSVSPLLLLSEQSVLPVFIRIFLYRYIDRSSMSVFPTPMTAADVVVEAKEVAYQGFFRMEKLTIRHKRFNGEWMGPFTRELFERGQAVCVLLFDPEKDAVVLLEQFRVGALADDRSPWLIELVAGMVEEGETPEDVALRESEEEAGTVPTKLIPVCDYWVSPGGTSEKVAIYCGLIDSEGMGGLHGLDDEHEDIRAFVVPFDDAYRAVEDGTINNAATIMALQWLKINHASVVISDSADNGADQENFHAPC